MKLADNAPLVLVLVRNLLLKEERVEIIYPLDKRQRVMFVSLRGMWGLDDDNDVWIIRSRRSRPDQAPYENDLRLPGDLDIDDLLKLEKTKGGWAVIPDWFTLSELGVNP